MVRNIDHRIETTIPIYDHDIQQQIQKTLDIQINSTKERSGKVAEKNPLDVQELTYSFVQTLQSKPQHKKSKK
jgi:polyphosphate kinase